MFQKLYKLDNLPRPNLIKYQKTTIKQDAINELLEVSANDYLEGLATDYISDLPYYILELGVLENFLEKNLNPDIEEIIVNNMPEMDFNAQTVGTYFIHGLNFKNPNPDSKEIEIRFEDFYNIMEEIFDLLENLEYTTDDLKLIITSNYNIDAELIQLETLKKEIENIKYPNTLESITKKYYRIYEKAGYNYSYRQEPIILEPQINHLIEYTLYWIEKIFNQAGFFINQLLESEQDSRFYEADEEINYIKNYYLLDNYGNPIKEKINDTWQDITA